MTESFTCPRCGRTSHNPNDVAECYCGYCHDWTVVRCPGCELKLAANDIHAQIAHMERVHPDLISARLIAAGFALGDGQWIDTLAEEAER